MSFTTSVITILRCSKFTTGITVILRFISIKQSVEHSQTFKRNSIIVITVGMIIILEFVIIIMNNSSFKTFLGSETHTYILFHNLYVGKSRILTQNFLKEYNIPHSLCNHATSNQINKHQ